ncbi:MAG: SRPBCC domain-containing protein [Saprospiraceae bacterium]|nr:SRPBCC domain-containing protein [Saprospiraceae bacterium]MBK7738892.1 SRPBCC domain-containing protein [Saprospiraceae bacterium]MBK7912543.1 SRPBCC domain-containing protein [Saprospiraceae bacterium]
MKNIRTEILINRDITNVWDVLMNFESYPKWNPFIRSISGEPKLGNRLIVIINPPGGKGMTFKPKILTLEPNKEFRWKGKLGINGIFDGEHYFILEYLDKNKTKFIHGEKFSGILVYFAGKMLDKTEKGFQIMNESIKNECEIK